MQRLHLKFLLWVLITLFVPTMAGLAVIDSGLKVPAAPLGIISFELCGFLSTCDATLQQWGVEGRQLAMLSLGLDYLFMVIYPSLVCVGLLLVVASVPARAAKLTRSLAWIALLAGAADAFENYFLIRVVLTGSGASHGVLASICSAIKFSILGITLGWLILASIAYAFRRSNPSQAAHPE